MKRVERFRNDQRVRVVDADDPLFGRTGKVVRLRRADNGAWVEMDEDLPESERYFPVGDSRERHVLLAPYLCEEVQSA